MDQFLAIFVKYDPNWGSIIFIMVMSFFVAIFHTVILSSLFNLDFNKKLFFILNPSLIGICGLIDTRLALVVFLLISVSVFILGISGVFVASIRDKTETKKEIENFYKKYQILPSNKTKKIIFSSLFITILFVGMFYIGFQAILILIALVLIDIIFLPTNKRRFLKYQAILPVSKIRSIAMGLVEVEGKLRMIKPLKAPVSGKECIGFHYTIETITRGDNGEDNYSTIFSETVCNNFLIEDDTGAIEIDPKKIELVWIHNVTHERLNSKRYSDNTLNEGDEVILIGNASIDSNNKPIIKYDGFRKVLAIAPPTAVTGFNANKPFKHSFIFFTCIYCVLIVLVLITPIEIQYDTISIKKPDWTIFYSTPKTKEN